MARALLFLLAAAAWAAAPAAAVAENPIDLSSLFSASFAPLLPCSRPCLSDLIHAARELLFFKDTIGHFESLCRTYENASLCVAEAEVACGHEAPSFAANVDPVQAMCRRKSDALAPLMPCVEKNVDAVLNVCDSSCLFTSSLSELSRRDSIRQMAEQGGDNRFALVTELTSLCPATSCFISCLAKSLDAACPPAGDDIVGALLRPFRVYAEMLEADEALKTVVFKVAPPTCFPFLVDAGLDNMQKGLFAKNDSSSSSSGDVMEPRSMDDEADYFGDLPAAHDSKDSLSTLLSASGLPTCTDACLSDLLVAAARIFDFNNTIEHFEELCTTYSNASLCVAAQEIQCVHEASFSVGVSGLEEMCSTKRDQFARHAACLRPIIDSSLQACDGSCQFTESINNLIASSSAEEEQMPAGADAFEERATLYQELAPVCPATGCMIACISRSLNRDCSPAGEEIAEALLRPFLKAAEMLIDLGPESFEAVKSILPTTCHTFISLTDLADIMEGKQSPKWGSPVEAEALVEQIRNGNELEEVIIFEHMQNQQDQSQLVSEAVAQDLAQQEALEASLQLQQLQHPTADSAHFEEDHDDVSAAPESTAAWGGRPRQVPRPLRLDV